jgi:hypothetical protein
MRVSPVSAIMWLRPIKIQPSVNFDRPETAGLEENVEVRRDFSRNVAADWNRPIRLLWIDGDHSHFGCKKDFAQPVACSPQACTPRARETTLHPRFL